MPGLIRKLPNINSLHCQNMVQLSYIFALASLQLLTSVVDCLEQAPLYMAQTDVSTTLLISDVLPRTQRIGIFSSFTRDIDSVSSRLESSSLNATVLAPENGVIKGLPRKPWEDPEEYKALGEDAYNGDDGNNRAQVNLKRFVESHVVLQSPWKEDQKAQTLSGNVVWFEIRGDKRMVYCPGYFMVECCLRGLDPAWRHRGRRDCCDSIQRRGLGIKGCY